MAEHKYHRARTSITTQLPVEQAVELARRTVRAQQTLTLERDSANELGVVLRNTFGVVCLSFSVGIAPFNAGTRLKTELHEYLTQQPTYFSVIPVGPKEIQGYRDYRRFMFGLGRVIQAADPSAITVVVERDGAVS